MDPEVMKLLAVGMAAGLGMLGPALAIGLIGYAALTGIANAGSVFRSRTLSCLLKWFSIPLVFPSLTVLSLPGLLSSSWLAFPLRLPVG